MRNFGNIIRVYSIYLFIDFQKARDSIHRDTLWKCTKEFKIPTKLLCVKHVYRRQEVRLK